MIIFALISVITKRANIVRMFSRYLAWWYWEESGPEHNPSDINVVLFGMFPIVKVICKYNWYLFIAHVDSFAINISLIVLLAVTLLLMSVGLTFYGVNCHCWPLSEQKWNKIKIEIEITFIFFSSDYNSL